MVNLNSIHFISFLHFLLLVVIALFADSLLCMQGLFVSIGYHSKISTFDCGGNWTCFWIPCGQIYFLLT